MKSGPTNKRDMGIRRGAKHTGINQLLLTSIPALFLGDFLLDLSDLDYVSA